MERSTENRRMLVGIVITFSFDGLEKNSLFIFCHYDIGESERVFQSWNYDETQTMGFHIVLGFEAKVWTFHLGPLQPKDSVFYQPGDLR